MQKKYQVCASNGIDEYLIEFEHRDERLTVFCSCAAGSIGKMCKHKLGLLEGTVEALPVDLAEQIGNEIAMMVGSSQVAEMLTHLREAEDAASIAESALKRAKREIERSIRPKTSISKA